MYLVQLPVQNYNFLSVPCSEPNKTIIYSNSAVSNSLPVVLYVCEIWSLIFREEHRLRVFENGAEENIWEYGSEENLDRRD
jgi:hypothetical protein